MASWTAVAVGLVALLAGAGPATAATPPLRVVAESVKAPVADGERHVAFETPAGTTRVLDTSTGGAREVQTPVGCAPVLESRGVIAVGGDQLLWQCRDERVRMLDLATGAIHEPPGRGVGSEDATDREWNAIGRSWIAGREWGYHWTHAAYWNWRTGAVVAGPGSPRQVADLDLAQLSRRLCASLRRDPNPERSGVDVLPRFAGYQYDRPYGLSAVGPPGMTPGYAARVEVDRCGRARPQIVSRCPLDCWQLRLSAGVLTWVRTGAPGRAVVTARRMASGRERRWTADRDARVVHTRTHVVVSVRGPTRDST